MEGEGGKGDQERNKENLDGTPGQTPSEIDHVGLPDNLVSDPTPGRPHSGKRDVIIVPKDPDVSFDEEDTSSKSHLNQHIH